MRFLFASAQLPGHLDWGGYLPTAVELQRRGHVVLWATGQPMAAQLAQAQVPSHILAETGWRWPPPPPLPALPNLAPEEVRHQRALRALDQWLEEERVIQATAALVAVGRSFQPDIVVSEVFLSAAGLAAEVLQKPFAVVGWPAMTPQTTGSNASIVAVARERLGRIYRHFGITGRHWTAVGPPAQQSAQLHITYWSPRWYAGIPLLPQTRHVGGKATASPQPAPPWPTDQPWVFITLGTSFGQDATFFRAAAQAAATLGCLPIVALGGQFKPDQEAQLCDQLPKETIVEQRVDLSAVLPHVAAAIHHGGAGVTHALVTQAVPQLIVPHAADQMHQAQGVVRSQAGLHLPAQQASQAALVNGLAQLLPDRAALRQGAEELRAEFAQQGGIAAAADLLEQLQ
ncbi:MAG: hypothetical protein KF832_06655 [Caldilineaceae bacterium]|nr:hypothetical protein [Caldilineaceae bacterium]